MNPKGDSLFNIRINIFCSNLDINFDLKKNLAFRSLNCFTIFNHQKCAQRVYIGFIFCLESYLSTLVHTLGLA
jgi:hypothetical protein